MKIGDAGEAFFIFETEDDIPEEIATSPLLEATKPGEANANQERTGRFGAKVEGTPSPSGQHGADTSQEPDFLDLDATGKDDTVAPTGSPSPPSGTVAAVSTDTQSTQESDNTTSLLTRTAALGKAALGVVQEVGKAETDKFKDKTVKDALKEVEEEQRDNIRDGMKAAANYSPFQGPDRGDEVLPHDESNRAKTPEVTYGHGK